MTTSILRTFHKIALSSFDKAICELFIGTFFFARRSCKYVQVSNPHKTKLLTIKNIPSTTPLIQKIWASIICRINSYPTSNPDMPVNTFLPGNFKLHKFSGQELLKRLHFAAATLGPEELGFSPSEIGLHSAHGGASYCYVHSQHPSVHHHATWMLVQWCLPMLYT